jgi:hypothetical protein
MASDSRTAEREEERRLNMRTLVIASAASAAAALLTSQLWIAGTWIAAAMTPVIVSLVSELLNRPTERIAKSFTSDRSGMPAASGAGRPARPYADPLPDRVPEESVAGAGRAGPPARGVGSEAPVRVYRSGQAEPRSSRARSGQGPGGRITRTGGPGTPPSGRSPTTRRRKIAYGAVFGTAAIAFLIAVAAITLPELVAGSSVGKNDGRTTFFSSKKDGDRDKEQAPQDTTKDEQQQPDEQQQTPARPDNESTPPAEEPAPVEEAPSEQDAPPEEPLQETTPVPPAAQP